MGQYIESCSSREIFQLEISKDRGMYQWGLINRSKRMGGGYEWKEFQTSLLVR